jgi:hypothetical protein
LAATLAGFGTRALARRSRVRLVCAAMRLPPSVATPLGSLGLPPDAVALTALLVAVAWAALAWRRRDQPARAPRFRLELVFWSAAAAALSAAYVPYYLRGGPRVIDATSYLLEARFMASGAFCVAPGLPSAALRGRFLVGQDASECLGVLFPPGYPLALAAAVALGVPLLLGPLTAGAQCAVLLLLARRHLGLRAVGVAGALYALCACARYHTADTMSHGWAALLLTTASYAWGSRRRWADRGAGACLGWLVATRPVTGFVCLVALGLLTKRSSARELARRSADLLLGAAPFVALLLLYDRALTGEALLSPQTLYYALADGEPGCFRYGFGVHVGCKHEHGDFIATFMPDGFGLVAALGTTSRRLLQHLRDAGNSELGALALVLACCSRRVRGEHAWLPLVIGAQVLAYLPFYYDGNYPAGGARMFADVLPLEHLLLAAWLAPVSWRALAGPLSLAGFALHGAYDHDLLGSREGGRPYFERSVVEAAGVERGLVFVPSDHGFNLAHGSDPSGALEFVRWHGDGHDRVAWETRGRPPAYVYEWFAGSTAVPRLRPYDVSELAYRFEAEQEWPVLAVSDGWARPQYEQSGCASAEHVLVFTAMGARARVTLELPVPQARAWRVRVATLGAAVPELTIDGAPLATLPVTGVLAPCHERISAPIALAAGARRVSFAIATGESARIDYVELGE